jgi:hypothetical protein
MLLALPGTEIANPEDDRQESAEGDERRQREITELFHS